MKKKKILDYVNCYYVNRPTNQILMAIILGLIIGNLVLFIQSSQGQVWTDVKYIVQLFCGTIPAGILGVVLLVLQTTFKKMFSSDNILYENISIHDMYHIKRREQLQKLEDCIFNSRNKVLVVTGESGSGKSTLLYKIMRKYKAKVYYKDSHYSKGSSWDETVARSGKQVVILDQFERALSSQYQIQKLRNFVQQGSSKVVLCVRKENFFDVYKLFSSNIDIYTLNFNGNDMNNIMRVSRGLVDKTEKAIKKDEFFKPILKGKIPSLITIQMIWKSIEVRDFDSVLEDWKRCKKDYDQLVSCCIQNDMLSLTYPNIGYAILYLLCKDTKCQYRNSLKDFCNVTFEEKKNIQTTLKELYQHGLIRLASERALKKHNTTELEKAIKKDKTLYAIKHDYILERVFPICLEILRPDVMRNIEDYHLNCQLKISDKRNYVDLDSYEHIYQYSIPTHPIKYKIKSRSSMIVSSIVFVFMMAGIIGANIISWCPGLLPKNHLFSNSDLFFSDNYFMLSILCFLVGLSIYYIYNYHLYFLRIFGYSCIHVLIIGAVVSIGVFVIPGLWAAWLGTEVLVVGLTMIGISKSKKTRESERSFFMKKSIVFSMIGIFVIALGIYFWQHVYAKGTGFSILFFMLYFIYILICIATHINKNYILSLLGKFNIPKKLQSKK